MGRRVLYSQSPNRGPERDSPYGARLGHQESGCRPKCLWVLMSPKLTSISPCGPPANVGLWRMMTVGLPALVERLQGDLDTQVPPRQYLVPA